MAPSTLEALPSGASVFVDATVFVYHFTGASAACKAFLARCAGGDIEARTSVVVLAEVTHRLMLGEAVSRGLVAGPNVLRKVRAQPEIVRQLVAYNEQVDRIARMGVQVLPLAPELFSEARALRERHGLLTNDSLLLAAALRHGIDALATADRDFERVRGLRVFRPADLAG